MSENIDRLCPGTTPCPAEEALLEAEAPLHHFQGLITESVLDGLTGEAGVDFDKSIDAWIAARHFSDEDARRVKLSIRSRAADFLTDIDEEITSSENHRRQLGATCDRALRMRARKNGQEFTVTLCTSPLVYDNPEFPYAPLIVEVKSDDSETL